MRRVIHLDVSDRRARIVGGVDVDLGAAGVRRLDAVDIDTGSSVDLLLPLTSVGGVLPDGAAPTDPIEGVGGEVEAWVIEGTLLRRDHALELPAAIHFAALGPSHVPVIGLPLLRHFDILLREPFPGDMLRPGLLFEPLR